MSWMLVPARVVPGLLLAARDGDAHALQIREAIESWAQRVDRAIDSGIFPACGSCSSTLHHGEVCGWMILAPDEGIGLTAALCHSCIKRSRAELYTAFKDALREELQGDI